MPVLACKESGEKSEHSSFLELGSQRERLLSRIRPCIGPMYCRVAFMCSSLLRPFSCILMRWSVHIQFAEACSIRFKKE